MNVAAIVHSDLRLDAAIGQAADRHRHAIHSVRAREPAHSRCNDHQCDGSHRPHQA
jgi:hypothetical protein